MKRKQKLLLLLVLVLTGCISGLNAQTLKHSYTFEPGTYDVALKKVYDQVGTANGTINGDGITFKNGYVMNTRYQADLNTSISFNGTELGLNTYSAVTMEYYANTFYSAVYWTMFAYFGGDGGANSFYSTLLANTSGGKSRASLNNTVFSVGALPATRTTHHYVAVLTPSKINAPGDTTKGTLKWYIDGVIATSTDLKTTDTAVVKNIATTNAYLFRGPSAWNDPKWLGNLYEFNLYDGAMDDAKVAAQYGKFNSQLATLTSTAGTLKPAFNSNILDYALHLTSATNTLDIAATPSQAGAVVKGTGTYDVSGTDGVIKVYVDTAKSVAYYIHWDKPIPAELKHSYTFADNTATDVVGGANGTLSGINGKIANGSYVITNAGDLNNDNLTQETHITLPAAQIGLSKYPSFTMEAYYLGTNTTNPYIFYYGGQAFWGVNHYYMNATGSTISANILFNPWSGATAASSGTNANMLDGTGHHAVAVVYRDTMYAYRDGALVTKTLLGSENQVFNIQDEFAYIGRPGYKDDRNFVGTISEYNIYKGALDTATIRTRSIAYHSADALLKSLTASTGTFKPAFNTVDTSFAVVLPVGTTSVLLSAVPSNSLSSIADTGTVNVSSGNVTRKVIVTAPNGTSKTYRNVNLRYISNDSILSSLKVNGTTIDGFASNVYNYTVALPAGTSVVPTVTATANFMYATSVITAATTLPGTTKVVVTAENGTSKTTYNVNFTFIDPTIATDKSILYFDDVTAKDSLLLNGANLTADISITAPAGIKVNPTSILKSSATDVKVYVTYDSLTTVNDTIRFTSGSLVQKVAVKAIANSNCFTPLYSTGNLISDPTFKSISSFGGWGNKVLNSDPANAYCGNTCGKIAGTDICWPNGGSIDASLSLKPLTKYVVRAMVKTMDGSFELSVGKYNGAAADINNFFNTNGVWQSFTFEFTTGTVVTGAGCYFNNCNGSTGKVGYIDNWEVYELASVDASLSDLQVNSVTVNKFSTDSMTYNVVLPFGTTTIPVVNATATQANATLDITQASSVNGTATVVVTAQDGTTKKTYTINFSVSTVSAPLLTNKLVTVKPTVSNSYFVVEFTDKPGTITVYDLKGSVVNFYNNNKLTEVVNVPRPGVYLMKINVGSEVKTVKIEKTK